MPKNRVGYKGKNQEKVKGNREHLERMVRIIEGGEEYIKGVKREVGPGVVKQASGNDRGVGEG